MGLSASELEKQAAADDATRPTLDRKGSKRMYHVGLVDDAPFEYITVPTVVLRGTVRGKCVEVPKRTAVMRMQGNTLHHGEGQRIGRFESLFDIEVDGFLKYCDTHIFRKVSDYEIPETVDGKATGKKIKKWRAEVEPSDPSMVSGGRGLHSEESDRSQVLSKYVWIVPANLDRNGKPMDMGGQDPIEVQRANKTFFRSVEEPKQAAPPTPPQGGGKPK